MSLLVDTLEHASLFLSGAVLMYDSAERLSSRPAFTSRQIVAR